jgi:phosphoglycolate phosphatase
LKEKNLHCRGKSSKECSKRQCSKTKTAPSNQRQIIKDIREHYRNQSKPYPDHLLLAIKKNKFMNKKKYACYVGDTKIDYSAAIAANIDFIFASYGYGKIKNNVKKISKFSELKKFL